MNELKTTHDYKAKYQGRFLKCGLELNTGIECMGIRRLGSIHSDPVVLVDPVELESIISVLELTQ